MPQDSTSAASVAPISPATHNGTFFVIAGPAGAGKNSLMQRVIESGVARQLATATTRPMRSYEQQGREHMFVSRAEFERMIAAGELLEFQRVHDNYYGIHRPSLENAMNAGETIMSDIDINGAEAARKALPDNVVVIFVQAPTIADLIDRMRIRGESIASIGLRLLRVGSEIEYAERSDAVITNDKVENAAEKLLTIVQAVQSGGRNSAYCDSVITYRYKLFAQAIPFYAGEALCRKHAPDYPVAEFAAPEQPASAARRALRDALPAITLPPEVDPSAYRAPAVIDHRVDDSNCEIVTYSYFVPLESRIAAPEGWTWQPVAP